MGRIGFRLMDYVHVFKAFGRAEDKRRISDKYLPIEGMQQHLKTHKFAHCDT